MDSLSCPISDIFSFWGGRRSQKCNASIMKANNEPKHKMWSHETENFNFPNRQWNLNKWKRMGESEEIKKNVRRAELWDRSGEDPQDLPRRLKNFSFVARSSSPSLNTATEERARIFMIHNWIDRQRFSRFWRLRWKARRLKIMKDKEKQRFLVSFFFGFKPHDQRSLLHKLMEVWQRRERRKQLLKRFSLSDFSQVFLAFFFPRLIFTYISVRKHFFCASFLSTI